MKAEIKVTKEVEIKTLHVKAGVRYWEDATVNGKTDDKGNLIPCKVGDYWKPIIDIDKGKIINWLYGIEADIHYKVCDDGTYALKDANNNTVLSFDGYVPSIMCPEENGCGDYIIMKVDKEGNINNWNANIEDFYRG